MEKPTAEMSCINPAEYEPWELEAYADGEDMPRVKFHLEKCDSCRTQLQRIKYIDSGLTASFFRFDCPPLDTLYDYHQNDIAASERASIKLHLDLCPHCVEESQRIREFDQIENVAPVQNEAISLLDRLTERVEDVSQNVSITIASLFTPQNSAGAAPAFRGDVQKTQLLFKAEETMISLSLDTEQRRTAEITGQVLSSDNVGEDARFRLVSADQEFTGAVNAAGVFTIADVQKGLYQLTLHLASQTIVIPNLSI